MSDLTAEDRIRRRYHAFAVHEARGHSPAYEARAEAIAGSDEAIAFIASLPEGKRQPNLVLASARWVCGLGATPEEFVDLIGAHRSEIRTVAHARGTQTNEPGRCATLVPVLASLPQPVALLEVGASAGLCLLPDRFGYDYGGRTLLPADAPAATPVFPCETNDLSRVPDELPRVAWRLGVDLNPLDIADPECRAWLENLVWPGQEARLGRLQRALAAAEGDPPRVVRRNLLHGLLDLVSTVPPEATLVVFHSAVLAYVEPLALRLRFQAVLGESKAVWISNEAPSVFPAIAARLPEAPSPGRFVLSRNGEPLALTGPHGQSLEWLDNRGP